MKYATPMSAVAVLLLVSPACAEAYSSDVIAQTASQFYAIKSTCGKYMRINPAANEKYLNYTLRDGINKFGGEHFNVSLREAHINTLSEMRRIGEKRWCFEHRGIVKQLGYSDLFPK